ncbi:MAG: diguanylate cyclase [Zoogloeaceae bacterium]|nr:diguanylate cyclase [Zoogloeaceae bacterium]
MGGVILVALAAGAAAAIANHLCARRLRSDAGFVIGGLQSLPLDQKVQEVQGADGGDLRQAFESAAAGVTRLAEQESLMRAVADSAHGVEALFDLEGRLLWVNPSVERLTGYSPAECLAAEDLVTLLVHANDQRYVRTQAKAAASGGEGVDQELRLRNRAGGSTWVLCHWRPFCSGEGRQEGVRLSLVAIQARKEAEYRFLETVAELRRAQALSEHYLARSADERQRMSALLNVIRLGILFMDRDHRVQYYNQALSQIWGYEEDENLLGVRDVVLQSRIVRLIRQPEVYLEHVRRVVAEAQVSEPFEIEFVDGRIITDKSTVVEGADGHGAIGRVWIYEDVTEARETSRKLVELAERDPLTNLYNRRRFHEEVERVLADATRRGDEVGLVVLDLDGFKPINDRYGHQAGDEVLVTLARELGRIVRRNEMFFRLGGDEFAILASDASEAALSELAKRVVDKTAALSFRFADDDDPVGVTASLGLALYPRHARDGERLMAAADAAMYRAKVVGRNRWAMADGSSMSRVAGG